MNKRGFKLISTSSFILCQHLKREKKIVPKISGRTSVPSSQGSCHYVHGDMVENKKRFETILFQTFCSCGGSTRTNDLQVMSLASYQLLHSASSR